MLVSCTTSQILPGNMLAIGDTGYQNRGLVWAVVAINMCPAHRDASSIPDSRLPLVDRPEAADIHGHVDRGPWKPTVACKQQSTRAVGTARWLARLVGLGCNKVGRDGGVDVDPGSNQVHGHDHGQP